MYEASSHVLFVLGVVIEPVWGTLELHQCSSNHAKVSTAARRYVTVEWVEKGRQHEARHRRHDSEAG